MPNEFDEQAFFDAGFDAIGHAKIPGEPSPIEHWIQPEQKTSTELEAGAELDAAVAKARGDQGWNRLERNPNWQGGRFIDSQGYRAVSLGGRYDREHRLAAEAKIGRPLVPGEVVHHINGNRLDNRAENIEVLPSQSEHMKKHMSKERAREMQKIVTEIRFRRLTKKERTAAEQMLSLGGTCQVVDCRELFGQGEVGYKRAADCISRLLRKGFVKKVGRGRFSLTESCLAILQPKVEP